MRMGFEANRPRPMRGEPSHVGAHYPFLADYCELRGAANIGYGGDDDGDGDAFTWPDLIDQRGFAMLAGAARADDAEEDDPSGGNVTDEPHDARDEDGI